MAKRKYICMTAYGIDENGREWSVRKRVPARKPGEPRRNIIVAPLPQHFAPAKSVARKRPAAKAKSSRKAA